MTAGAATAVRASAKGVQEVAEAGLKKATKELVEEGAEKAAKEATEKAAKEVAEEATEQTGKRAVVKTNKSLREQYLGRTPGKNSKTGREVFERMKNETPPRARINNGEKEFWDKYSNKWRNISEADMGHIEDAVHWWNREGKKYGAKSKEVRKWMLDSDNYELEYYKVNRSRGAKLTETYDPPLK